MADFLATNEFPGTGAVMQVEINFAGLRPDLPGNPAPYLETDDVKAVIVTPATDVSVEVQVPVDLVKVNNTTFNTDVTVVPVGQVLRVYRATDIEFPLVDFVSLQVVSESDLDNQARQVLYAVMESSDNAKIATDRASFAAEVAVVANVASIDAVAQAGAAVATANAASAAASAAVVTANAANVKSDEALTAAALAEDHASAVESLAAAAAQDADDAAASAVVAISTANNALSVANAIDAKAQSALDTSVVATTTANNAMDVANAIDAKAQSALDASAAATSTANAANDTANEALTLVESAVTSFNGRGGAVVPTSGDYTAAQITSGATNVQAVLDGHTSGLGTINAADTHALLVTRDYISHGGLLASFNTSNPFVTISPGSFADPATGKLITLDAATSVTLATTASIWQIIWGFDNGDGTAGLEVTSGVAPVRYLGTAFRKTGDLSRRFLVAIRNNGAGTGPWRFKHTPGRMAYMVNIAGMPFAVVTGLTNTTAATVNAGDVAYADVSTHVFGMGTNYGNASSTVRLASMDLGVSVSTAIHTHSISASTSNMFEIEIDSLSRFQFMNDVSGGTFTMRLNGYAFER
jgi:hypothetical protein